MKKYNSFLILTLCGCLISATSCDKKEVNKENITIGQIRGFAEKGPFAPGSSVTLYELDSDLRETGRTFYARTNDEGAFTVDVSTELASKYVKLSVQGSYFNEYTGKFSDVPIILEGLTEIEKEGNPTMNVNLLTHLETSRILQLVQTEKTDFKKAKKQAEEELLSAFLITGQSIIPEEIRITADNTSSNILIAISSILLNQRSDTQASDLINMIREDLSDGQLKDETIKKIEDSSLGLNYSTIKKHLIDCYTNLGKTIEVGNFELFIDGDGDGEIGDPYEQKPSLPEEDFFSKEEHVTQYMQMTNQRMIQYFCQEHLLEALYTQTVPADKLQSYYDLREIYEHKLTPVSNPVSTLWQAAYNPIINDNLLIEKATDSPYDWFKKYIPFSRTYRAYKYLSMINLWGDVILITRPSDPDEAATIVRTSKENVLDFIIEELTATARILPEKGEGQFCDRYFAVALLARAYLEKKDYSNALKYASEIIHSGKFELSADYDAIFEGGNKEVIFELSDAEDNVPKAYHELIRKGNYTVLSRYSETLLTASEANYKLGNTEQAVSLLNQVRRRNGKGNLTHPENIETALLEEWKEDLNKEGFYFAALKRFGMAEKTLNIPEYKLLLPVPQSEIEKHPLMTQNPGY